MCYKMYNLLYLHKNAYKNAARSKNENMLINNINNL